MHDDRTPRDRDPRWVDGRAREREGYDPEAHDPRAAWRRGGDPRSDLGPWEPVVERPRPVWASARFAAALLVVLVVLVGLAVVLPGLDVDIGAGPQPTRTPGGSAVAASPSGSVRPSFVRPTPTPVPTFMVYLVKSGDSLNSIADEFRTTARSIAFWNGDDYPSLDPESDDYEPNRIEVGWRLRVIPGAVYDEDAEPGSTPAVSPAPTVAPATPPPSGPAAVVSHGDRDGDGVALTFDIGGRLDPALDIMDWLVAHRVKATIFPTGEIASTTQVGRAVLAIVRDHPELFSLGNHSWDHPSFTELAADEMADELIRTENAVAPLAGRTTRPWFRPPFGAWNTAVRDGVGAAGWPTLVMWDVDTIDWRPTSDGGPTAGDIVAKVLANAQSGSIVLMHLGGYNTLDALPGMVAGLQDRGLRPVTLDEMLDG
jgi:peptidoglycan/xylan/chitin deacetylase (PgdA/CDA1 family)